MLTNEQPTTVSTIPALSPPPPSVRSPRKKILTCCSENDPTNHHQRLSNSNETRTFIDADLETIRLSQLMLDVHANRTTRMVVGRVEAIRLRQPRQPRRIASETNCTELRRNMCQMWMRILGWKWAVCRWDRLLLSRPQRCRFPNTVCIWFSTSNIRKEVVDLEHVI